MAPFKHSAVSLGVSETPPTRRHKEHRSNITAQRYKRYLLHLEEWLSLAASASRIPALGNRLLLVQEMAYRWDV
jgi:hypothetical protein